jgi:hypothetical protein
MLFYHLGDEQQAGWWPHFKDVVSPHRHDHHKRRFYFNLWWTNYSAGKETDFCRVTAMFFFAVWSTALQVFWFHQNKCFFKFEPRLFPWLMLSSVFHKCLFFGCPGYYTGLLLLTFACMRTTENLGLLVCNDTEIQNVFFQNTSLKMTTAETCLVAWFQPSSLQVTISWTAATGSSVGLHRGRRGWHWLRICVMYNVLEVTALPYIITITNSLVLPSYTKIFKLFPNSVSS